LARISELINQMMMRLLESSEWTSANPTHINTFIQANAADNPDFENEIKQLVKEQKQTVGPSTDVDTKKQDTQLLQNTKQLKLLEKTNMAEINRLTSSQFGNIREIATNPTGFITKAFLRKFAKGAGVIALALIIFEAVKWVISELLKPGRMLDIRFKRDITKEIIAFRRREDQQNLKQGFSSIIITTTPRLRGGMNQITNTLNMAAGREKFPDNIGIAPIQVQASGVDISKSNGRRFNN
jgi:hypothetical protein